MNTVFVYGTLRPLSSSLRFLPTTHSLYGFRMLDLGPYPCIVEVSYSSSVHGRLLHVTNAELKRLDRIEGTDKGIFNRQRVGARNTRSGGFLLAWAYVFCDPALLNADNSAVIECGNWAKRNKGGV